MTLFSTAAKPSRSLTDLDFTPRRLGHVKGFDGIRGFGVIIVVITHFNIILPTQFPQLLVVPGGVVSLDTFFVMSGFLITYLLLREQSKTGRVSSWGFYRRRALRLLPALVALLIAHVIYAHFAGIDPELERSSVTAVFFYYANWYLAFAPKNILGGGIMADGLQHTWSLSFEEQFYLVWPIATIFFFTIRTRLRTVVIVLVSVIVIVSLHRAQMFGAGLSDDPGHYNSQWYPTMIRTDTRVDSILIGALMAHIWIRNKMPIRHLAKVAWGATFILLLCLFLVKVETPFLYFGGFTIIDLSIAVVLLAVIEGDWGGKRFFHLRPFLWLGVVSYGLYLWHLPILFGVREYGMKWEPWIRVVVATILFVVLTGGSWFFIERPAMHWKDRLEARDLAKRAPPPDPTDHAESAERTGPASPRSLAPHVHVPGADDTFLVALREAEDNRRSTGPAGQP